MSKQPPAWDDALVAAGFVDPRNGTRPSYNQLAQAVGVPQSTVSAIVSGRSRRPKPENVQKIADALGIDVRVVAGWVGEKRTERSPYAPPAEADLLTDRQRRAVDEIIRAIVAERASATDDRTPDQPHPVDPHEPLADRPVPDGATPAPEDIYGLAALKRPSEGKRLKREADALGEESQDPEDWR